MELIRNHRPILLVATALALAILALYVSLLMSGHGDLVAVMAPILFWWAAV